MAEGGQVFGVHTVDEWHQHLQKGIDNKKLVTLVFSLFVVFFSCMISIWSINFFVHR